MELKTISQVSKDFGISARMLRYYEQAGLIQSLRKDDYAYRVYDENALYRLRQVIVLRKLRISVKEIISIINNFDAAEAVEVFMHNISEIDSELTALSTVKSILTRFIEEINEKTDVNLKFLGDDSQFSVINALAFSNNRVNEAKEKFSIGELRKANEDLMKLEDKDIRIVYLPPMTIAAAYAEGEDTESKSFEMVKEFVTTRKLLEIKPDARCFGFDCSKDFQGVGVPSRIYESWVSIPDDMEVPAPLVKRKFSGGLYAAHVLRAWDFEDWTRISEWVNTSKKYDSAWDSPRWESPETKTGQGLEEILNFYNYVQKHNFEANYLQLDLLFPIEERKFE